MRIKATITLEVYFDELQPLVEIFKKGKENETLKVSEILNPDLPLSLQVWSEPLPEINNVFGSYHSIQKEVKMEFKSFEINKLNK